MNVTYKDIKDFDSTYIYWSQAKELAAGASKQDSAKNESFAKFIRLASQAQEETETQEYTHTAKAPVRHSSKG